MTGPAVTRAPAELPRIGTAEFLGHSFVAGYNATFPGYMFHARVCGALGARQYARGVLGARTYDPANGYGQATEKSARPRTSAPYVPWIDLHVVMFGINEITHAPDAAAFKAALRAIAAKCRASRIIEDSHAAWSFTGGASGAVAAGSGMSGSTRWGITANGDKGTFTVPADVPAGSAVSLFIGAITPTNAFTLTWKKNGAAHSVDAITAGLLNGESYDAQLVKRFTGVTAGDQLEAACSGITGMVRFDCAAIESDPPNIVVINKVPKLPSSYAGVPAGAYACNDTRVGLWNTAIDEVAAEFGPSVIAVDLDPWLENGAAKFFDADLLHPNDLGHARIADAVLGALRGRQVPRAATRSQDFLSTLALYNGWTAVSGAKSPQYRVTSEGLVQCTGRIEHLTTAPAEGDTVTILPVGARPSAPITILAAGDGANPVTWKVGTDGGVAYAGGLTVAGAKASLDGIIFTAEQ